MEGVTLWIVPTALLVYYYKSLRRITLAHRHRRKHYLFTMNSIQAMFSIVALSNMIITHCTYFSTYSMFHYSSQYSNYYHRIYLTFFALIENICSYHITIVASGTLKNPYIRYLV